MQFDNLRAFPYPVLRPDVDDYRDGELQTTIAFQPRGAKIHAEIAFALSVKEIEKLVKANKAKYVVVFACRDTYLRKSVSSAEPNFTTNFKAGELRGQVQINPYVIASTDIENFKCELINEEFGKGPFRYRKGELLALDRPQEVYIDRDLFKPISSVFEINPDPGMQRNEWRVRLDDEKVKILMSPELKERVDAARNSTRSKAVLMNSIYFSAVMQCLTALRRDEGEYEALKWAQVFRQKCADMKINIDVHDECVLAQRLLNIPFAKVVEYVFEGAPND